MPNEIVARVSSTAPLTDLEIAQNFALIKSSVTGAGSSRRRADALGTPSIKPISSYLGAATGGGGNTRLMVVATRHPFSALEIGYVHLGGYGAATGIAAVVAVTDDPGPLDYALGATSATLKKAITPKRAGTEYNTLSADGWKAVTWAGASTASAADAGTNQYAIAWSDVTPIQAIQAGDGLYYALIRINEAAGPYTRGSYWGQNTGTQYVDDAGFAKVANFYRAGDHITDPSTWTTALTPGITDSPSAPLVVRFHGLSASAPATLMMTGDSRFDVVTDPVDQTTAAYRSTGFKVCQALNAMGKYTHLVRAASGGYTSAQYQQGGLALLARIQPTVAVYLVFSINDGTPTRALIDAAKARAVAFARAVADQGGQCVLVSGFPSGGSGAARLALMQELDAWCAQTGLPWLSPVALYGSPTTGDWAINPATGTSWSTDGTNHMTQTGYTDLAARIAALVAPLI